MAPVPKNLFTVLLLAARTAPEKGILVYPPGQTECTPERITYPQLLIDGVSYGRAVKQIPGLNEDTKILLHIDNHKDNIQWLWAIIAAGQVPAISTPFTNDVEQRRKHLLHLKEVLNDPIIITKERLLPDFLDLRDTLRIFTIENLRHKALSAVEYCSDGYLKTENDLAALMLTSGSTGNAKAVTLRHGQVISAIHGKATYHRTKPNDVFLNWIGMDHVANLTEIHLHAMGLAADQVHVHAGDLLANPLTYLRLIERHKAAYSFAPNFFLASVKKALESALQTPSSKLPDVSSMRALISGGEANSTALCASLTDLMRKLGAPEMFIRPGFGMTETCAGSIYGTECPTYDLYHGREFTCLGHCIPGITMRVTRPDTGVCAVNEAGNLEVTGRIIFNGYFNNPEATASSFTSDGWFITGDLAFIDDEGNLHLVGREKETIIINGVKYFPHEVEGAIEDAKIPGVTPSFTAVFPYRAEGADSETLCVVYLPSYELNDVTARASARSGLRNVVMKHCMARPYKIIPLDKSFLHKTALGKLSRNKIKKAFEAGLYKESIELDEKLLAELQGTQLEGPSTPTERAVQEIFVEIFETSASEIGVQTNLFDMGCSSLEIFRLKWMLQNTPGLPDMIPITTIISNPTVQSLAAALDPNGKKKEYDPVVVLRSEGKKSPLWLVHPGVGEVLIFLNLAQQINDRPIYALRARGFDGEPFFGSVDEMVATYLASIKRVQPQGPYAIAGYSYGGTLAFEMAKVLQREGAQLPFLAVFDQPPHIKQRMRHGGWADVLLTLARFFDLLPDQETEQRVVEQLQGLGSDSSADNDQLVDVLLASASNERLQEFGLDKKRLATWTSLALNSHTIAVDYEPSGHVPLLEVFYAQPIEAVAKTKKEWLETKLSKWSDFVDDLKFHEVQGHHYDLISPAHVGSFCKSLESRMAARGV